MESASFDPAESAAEFITDLLRLQTTWQTPRRPIFVWRGVGDATKFKLVPSAMRAENVERLRSLANLSGDGFYAALQEHQKPIYLEFRIAEQFRQIADRAGLTLPILPSDIAEAFNDFGGVDRDSQFQSMLEVWPPRGILPTLSLAQHYGLPTRLLDWSYDPLTAAYFAAESALSIIKNSDHVNVEDNCLGVWVANPHQLKNAQKIESADSSPAMSLEAFSPPKFQNPNLMAQGGLFTYVAGRSNVTFDYDRRPQNEVALHLLGPSEGKRAPTYGLHLLAWKHADELLVRLHNLGVSRAKLTPGFAGVAATLNTLADLKWKPG